MPKKGLPAADWVKRLTDYACGKFVFGRGQRPSSGSKWAKELLSIESCARHKSGAEKDLFSNVVKCACGYHKEKAKSKPSTSSVSAPSSSLPSSSSPSATVTSAESGQGDVKLPVLSDVAHSTEYASRLPVGWQQNMAEADREWVGKSVFIAKGRLKDALQFWWLPPSSIHTGMPDVKTYFLQKLFLWMPRKMLGVDFKCPVCVNCADNSLRSKGLYNRVRVVMDVKEFYYLAAEYMYCRICLGQFIAYDTRLIQQLSDAVKSRFPVLLTHKYACDRTVVSLLRSRTIGNSPTAMRNNLQEIHSEEWLRQQLVYLEDCQRHGKGLKSLKLGEQFYAEAPAMKAVVGARWFLACYVKDVFNRMETLKAMITSTYGIILKIDSTKKVCKKLQGKAANSAQWATNVGNERGEILMSILTTSESVDSLREMADGLMARYESAQIDQPKCLYTDRECCNQDGPSKFKVLFSKWKDLEVCLDIWHFMRRLALGCTSESHPLYGTFMSRLSSAIFEWDKTDLTSLKAAKKKEMEASGIPNPSESAINKALTKGELERHCRRRTKGVIKTTEEIESLILSLTGVTDSLGVAILKEELNTIWSEQKKHVACIQDIEGLQLYTVTGDILKGGQKLPVYRCARGSTSLESFHSHMVKFIPGTSANAVNFQAYLLDGLSRWNFLRSAAAMNVAPSPFRTFDFRLTQKVNSLSQSLHNKLLVPVHTIPAEYTGEMIGIEYLFKQSGFLLPKDEELEAEIDEGFEDFEDNEQAPLGNDPEEEVLPAAPVNDSSDDEKDDDDEEQEEEEEEQQSVDSRGIPGWDKVEALALALIQLQGISMTAAEADNIKQLFDALLDFDKMPIKYTAKVKKPSKGRFGRSKGGFVGMDAVKRCFLSAGSPASSPSKSRVVEAICLHLSEDITTPTKKGRYTSRWKLIMSAYNKIRQRLLNNEKLLENTNLILFTINETTLIKWFKDKTRRDEVKMLLQGVVLRPQRTTSHQPLPEPIAGPSSVPPPVRPLVFDEPEDTTGMAVRRGHPKQPEASTQKPMSRTTEWRKRKASGESVGPRKIYSCKVCNQPMSTAGHTQFCGQRYCPFLPDQIPKEEWLSQKKKEADEKKRKKRQ